MSRKKRMVLAIALFCAFVISSFGLVFAHVLDDFNLLGMFGITAVLDDKSEGGEETGFLLQSGQAETDPTVPEEEPGEHEETGDVEETGEPDEPGETEEIEEIKEIEEPGEPEDTSEPGEPVTAPAGEEPVDTDGSSEAVINSGTLSAASAASNWYVSGFTLPEVSWSGIGSGLGAVKSVEQVDSRQIMVIWLHDGEELRFPTYCLDSQTDFNDSPDYTESGISVDDCRIIFILNYSFPILTPAQITQLWGLENTISAAAAYEAAQYAVSTFTNPTHTLAPLSGIGEVLAQRLIAAAQAACEHGTPCEGYVYLPDERTALEIKFAEPLSGAVNKDSSTAGKYVFGPYKVISPGYEYANAAVDIDINGDGIAPEDWKIFDAAGIPLKHAYLNEDFYIHFSPPPKGNFALTAVLTDFEKINYLHLAKRMIDIDNLDHAENQEILYYEYGSDSPLPAAAEVLFENEETIIIDVLKEQLQGSDDLNGESFGIGVFILDDSLENVIAVKNKEELYAGGGTSISLTDFSSYVGSNYMIFIGELWENFEKELRGGYLVTQETEIYIDGVRTIDIKNIEADGENYIGYALKLDEMPFMLEIKFGNRRKTDEIFRLPTLEIEKSYVDLTGAPETEFKFSIFWLNEAAYEFIGEFSIEAEPLGNGGFDGKYAGNILDMIAAYWEASNRQDSYFDKTFLITEENYPNGYTADNEILRETDVTSGGQSGVKFYQYHAGRPLLPAAPNWSGTHRYPGIEFKLPQPAAAEEPDKLTILFKNTSSLTERSLDIKLSKTYINGKKETPFEFYLYRARNDEWYFIKEFSVIPNVYNDINIYDIIRADALEEGYNYLEFEYILIENWEIKPSTYMSPGNGSTEISAPEHGYFTLRDGSPNFIGVEERSGLFGEFDSITRSFHIDTNGRYASFKPEPDASGRILKAEESAPYYPGISLTLNSDEMFSAYEVSLNINFKNKDPETPRLDPEIAVEKSWVDLYGNPETPASGFGMFIAVIDENDTVIARNPLDLGRLDSIIEQIKELINGTSGISDYRGERFVIYENYPQRSEVPISSTVITLEDAEGFLPASDIRSGYISFPAGGDISGITAGYALNFIITEPGNTAPDGALPAVAFSFPNDPLKDYTDPPKIKILFINTGDRRYSLEVHKLGAKGGETLAGAVFELYNYRADWVYEDYSAAVPLGTLDMTESGSLIVRNLPPGDYVLIEILAPQGYKQPEDDGIIIVVRLGEDGAT
ncbi:MAG: prealbumin-like fold domain-containing protein, partial [Oscillospiraceae bacterium]|nr:prealbumin-like fold domain-containing protein [Oscillospiraceae bacterium]